MSDIATPPNAVVADVHLVVEAWPDKNGTWVNIKVSRKNGVFYHLYDDSHFYEGSDPSNAVAAAWPHIKTQMFKQLPDYSELSPEERRQRHDVNIQKILAVQARAKAASEPANNPNE